MIARKAVHLAVRHFWLLLLASLPLAAQSGQTNHVHYATPKEASKPAPSGALAPRLKNLGNHTFPVNCKGTEVQAFFNQGVNLAYGFNHAEAGRAFAEVARRVPTCAMAYWGQALVLGPNINAPMNPADEAKAYELIQKAISLKGGATLRERAYIDALATRYSGSADARKVNDKNYAAAMKRVSESFPGDLDAATLYAEALMDLRPWDYWMRDGAPYPGTREILNALDTVIQKNPNHPGALHYWIHLWEPTKTPERAEAEADRLVTLMPGAGHIVHMPGHIYQRVGRYEDVVRVNDLAIAADEDYIAQCNAQGVYPLEYYPHNVHFKWFGATMAGQSETAIAAARKTASVIPMQAIEQVPFLQGFLVVPYYALVRFGKWEELLKEPKPKYDSLFTRGVWHYSQGSAYAGLGRLDEADRELEQLKEIAADPKLPSIPASFSANSAADILRIAPEVLAGQIASARKDYETAVAHLDRAVRLQDALIYTEPDDWHYPVRHSLGAVLLRAGRATEAESVFWEDLRLHPENGWALSGLAKALRSQSKDEMATIIEQRLQKAWAHADVPRDAVSHF